MMKYEFKEINIIDPDVVNAVANAIEVLGGVGIQSMIDGQLWEEFKEHVDEVVKRRQPADETDTLDIMHEYHVYVFMLGKTKSNYYILQRIMDNYQITEFSKDQLKHGDPEAFGAFIEYMKPYAHANCSMLLPKEFFQGKITF